MNGQYIERIEIDALWNGHKHIRWDLQPGVNILSGVNGVGKSTILNRVVMHLLDIDKEVRRNDGVHLTFFPNEAKSVDFEVIRSFDRPMLFLEKPNCQSRRKASSLTAAKPSWKQPTPTQHVITSVPVKEIKLAFPCSSLTPANPSENSQAHSHWQGNTSFPVLSIKPYFPC